MIGTVLSELHLSHEFLLSLSSPKLSVLYQEALRQRTNKAFMLMELLGVHRIEKKIEREKVIKGYQKITNPFNIKREINQVEIENGWNTLRSR